MRRHGKKILLLLFVIFFVVVLSRAPQFRALSVRSVPHSEASQNTAIDKAEISTTMQNARNLVPAESMLVPNTVVELSKYDKIVQIWDAPTGQEVLNSLVNVDLSDPAVSHLLDKIRGTCQDAHKTYDGLPPSVLNTIAARHDKAVDIFVAKYCGDSSVLVARIDALLAPSLADLKRRYFDSVERGVEFEGIPPSKRWSELEKLTVASKTSIDAATALINEGLIEKNPIVARNIAERLVPASEKNGALAVWNDYLPPLLSRAERTLVFTIAAELNVCNRSQACSANRPLAIDECAVAGHRTCQPDEDLLSYRRRTTSPMLYQAAEQIAAAMQARRYR